MKFNFRFIVGMINMLFLFSISINAQKWIVYNKKNSDLPNNCINTIAVDKQGNKWLGTRNGVSKFDGKSWTNYDVINTNSGLADNFIYCILIDSIGNKWIGNACLGKEGTGLVKFDDKNWIKYNKSITLFNSMAFDSFGRLWYGTVYGAYVFDGVNWKIYDNKNSPIPNNQILGIASDKQGSVWLGSYKSGVLRFDGTNWTNYNTTNSGLNGNDVYCIIPDTKGNLWFGTNNGISKFDGLNWVTYNSTNYGLTGKIADMTIDSKEILWIATTKGVLRFDGTIWTTYNTSNSGLGCDIIYSVEIDRQGNKWFGTEKNGVTELIE